MRNAHDLSWHYVKLDLQFLLLSLSISYRRQSSGPRLPPAVAVYCVGEAEVSARSDDGGRSASARMLAAFLARRANRFNLLPPSRPRQQDALAGRMSLDRKVPLQRRSAQEPGSLRRRKILGIALAGLKTSAMGSGANRSAPEFRATPKDASKPLWRRPLAAGSRQRASLARRPRLRARAADRHRYEV